MYGHAIRAYAGPSGRFGRYGGIAIAVGLHLILVAALLSMAPVRSALTSAAPIVVKLVTPPPKVEVKPDALPKPLPVKPRVQKTKPVVTPPVMTAATEAPTPFVAPPAPLPPIEMPPAPAIATAAAAPVIAPAPAPIVPPNFNADYLNNPPPVYPAQSRRMGEQGRVVLRVYVSEQGLPAQVEMRTSSGHPRLDEAALATVKQWKFVPARRGETPVGAWVLVPISFSLRS